MYYLNHGKKSDFTTPMLVELIRSGQAAEINKLLVKFNLVIEEVSKYPYFNLKNKDKKK